MNRVFGIAVLVGLAACGAENLPPVETDVLVVGGTAKGVAAAVAAKAEGADVFLSRRSHTSARTWRARSSSACRTVRSRRRRW